MTGVPRHLAIVPDGNRRWARARGLAPSEGHRAGTPYVRVQREAEGRIGLVQLVLPFVPRE